MPWTAILPLAETALNFSLGQRCRVARDVEALALELRSFGGRELGVDFDFVNSFSFATLYSECSGGIGGPRRVSTQSRWCGDPSSHANVYIASFPCLRKKNPASQAISPSPTSLGRSFCPRLKNDNCVSIHEFGSNKTSWF